MRLYQTPNLLQVLSEEIQVTATDRRNASVKKGNLVSNLGARDSGGNEPIIDASGNRGSVKSRYGTSNKEMKASNNQAFYTVDLGSTYFQHAILFTIKIIDNPESNDVDQKKWAQNIRVRVGDKEDYNQNDDCTDDLLLDVNA